MNLKKQSGFTLVELVIVIAILGILSAVALPRFANFTNDATNAARKGVVGSLNSAIAIAHGKWLAQGGTGTVQLDGSATAITMNANGYPNVGTTYNDAATCTTLVDALLGGNASASMGNIAYSSGCSLPGSPAFTKVVAGSPVATPVVIAATGDGAQ